MGDWRRLGRGRDKIGLEGVVVVAVEGVVVGLQVEESNFVGEVLRCLSLELEGAGEDYQFGRGDWDVLLQEVRR